jgi:hypothetical protein
VEGCDRRSRNGRVTSDWERGVPSMDDSLVFWTFSVEAAMGGVGKDSAVDSWSKDCMALQGHEWAVASVEG